MNDEDPKRVRVLLLEDEDGARMLAGAGFAAELAAIFRDEIAPPRPPLEIPPLDVLLPPALNRHERRKQAAERRRRYR